MSAKTPRADWRERTVRSASRRSRGDVEQYGTDYPLDSDEMNRVGFASLAFRIIGAIAVLVGSFWITLEVLDSFGSADKEAREAGAKELRPTTWKTFGKASYQVRNGTVIMRGPNHILAQIECGEFKSNAKFSIFVEHAGVTNMQMLFLDARGEQTRDPLVQSIAAMNGQTGELSSTTPVGTRTVQALIYSPQEGEAASFKDPYLGCIPMPDR